MVVHVTRHRGGFPLGWTSITTLDEAEDNSGIALGVWKVEAEGKASRLLERETAFLLMDGVVKAKVGEEERTLRRSSLFDEGPSCVHASRGETVTFTAETAFEMTVFQVDNDRAFRTRIYTPEDVDDERRGAGVVGDASLRLVRTLFDGSNTPDEARLVLGEVLTLPGRWSSYPPHHHPQPELYHYRFTHPQGYGHAELGDDVVKVRQYDTMKIFSPHTHAQVAAPGYGMYYSWVIRHLDDARYGVPTFDDEHDWARREGAPLWSPKWAGPR